MKRSTKITSIIIIFFLIITAVVVGRTMIGNHFKKKFGKRPPPGIIITEVAKKEFSEKIETFGTAISKESKTLQNTPQHYIYNYITVHIYISSAIMPRGRT